MSNHIQIAGVNKIFRTGEREVVALKDINLTIKQGEFVCLLGPSGCGKSTLLNAVAASPCLRPVQSASRAARSPDPPGSRHGLPGIRALPVDDRRPEHRFGLEIQKKDKAEIELTVNTLLDLLHSGFPRPAFRRTSPAACASASPSPAYGPRLADQLMDEPLAPSTR